jgi:peptidoglycan-N-acetylglucosamine deacetylase
LVKIPFYIPLFFKNWVWRFPSKTSKVYLTFDDGPIPEVTENVLEILERQNIKATFFCIGDNIKKHPKIFQKLVSCGHAIGNHTYNHVKGWNVTTELYLENVKFCSEVILQHTIETKLFRPPYGRIKLSQAKALRKLGYKIIMWNVLSKDYDEKTKPKTCLNNIIKNTKSGSIIVCHDSIKAKNQLLPILEEAIITLKSKGFVFDTVQ